MLNRVPIAGGYLLVDIDETAGQSAPWMILSNSLAADHTMWDLQVPDLTRRYRLVRYDERGHGGSSVLPGSCTLDELSDEVVTIMDHLDINTATVMGASLGGMIGLTLALTHPKRISAVLCCAALAEMPQPICEAWDKRKEAVLRNGMSAVVDDTLARWLTPEFRAKHPETVEQVRTMILGTSPEGYAGCIEAIKRVDLLRHLPQISVPTLYVVGEMDGNSTPSAMRSMADATPGAALALIPHASHLPNIDNRAGFIEAISGFLEL